MENQDFKLNFKLVWILVISSTIFTIVGSLGKIQHWENPQYFLIAALIFMLFTWIIVLSDMVISKIYNKTFWITTMFFTAPVTIILYMFQRNKLLKYAKVVAENKTIEKA